jgi:putative endonuclease
MPNRDQLFGRQSETLAVGHLKKEGYKIIACNYRNRLGEIDIIAQEKGTLVFVEVKARRSRRYGNPKAAVTRAKQRKISMVALGYLKATRQSHVAARFDVVAIDYATAPPGIEIVRNAFDLAF